MLRRAEDGELIFDPRFRVHIGLVTGAFNQTHVRLKPAHRGARVAGVVDLNLKAGLREGLAEAGDEWRQQVVADGGARGNAQIDGRNGGRCAPADAECTFDARSNVQRRPCLWEESAAVFIEDEPLELGAGS